MAIALRYAARTDVGLVRSRNEDSGYAGPHLLVIADGMGGHAAGNVASSLTVGDLVHLDGDSLGSDDALTRLAASIGEANASLRAAMRDNPELAGMGTTVTALLRTGSNKLAMAHIGDSRAYLLRGGELSQITRDHSFVQSLVDEGRISEADAEHHPQRSLVTRVLTGHPSDEPDLSLREARIGDRYLICSDGLSDYVGRDTIAEVLVAASDPREATERLVGLALKAGAPDNVTCVVADVVDGSERTETNPEIVGAAAERRGPERTAPLPQQSPAEKAASLRREATGELPEHDDEVPVQLAEEGPRSRGSRVARRLLLASLVLVVLAGGAYAAYDWSQRQFFVGEQRGFVTVFRGLPQQLGPFRAASTLESSDVLLADLPDFYRTKVKAGVGVADLGDARKLVTDLRVEAIQCQNDRTRGQACDRSG
ncbi:MAG TPA: PP2C family serine/threonine-protein phosphatase [Dermatophilaceae bacterium]|nr:PP2C family serine/threonine-protein phosphatase [Dermatophilaceae bacterium]